MQYPGYIVAAYWQSRREEASLCARRLSQMLQELAECDESLSEWFRRGRSRAAALSEPVDTANEAAIVSLIEKGASRRDDNNQVIQELGFGTGLWNGRDGSDGIGLSVRCGLHCMPPDIGEEVELTNNLILSFDTGLGPLKDHNVAIDVLSIVARAWSPDWAGVMSRSSISGGAMRARKPFLDWMVFVPREIVGVKSPASIVCVPHTGTIIVAQPSPPQLEDRPSQERVLRLNELLGHAGEAAQDH